jgi:hypothetical protein
MFRRHISLHLQGLNQPSKKKACNWRLGAISQKMATLVSAVHVSSLSRQCEGLDGSLGELHLKMCHAHRTCCVSMCRRTSRFATACVLCSRHGATAGRTALSECFHSAEGRTQRASTHDTAGPGPVAARSHASCAASPHGPATDGSDRIWPPELVKFPTHWKHTAPALRTPFDVYSGSASKRARKGAKREALQRPAASSRLRLPPAHVSVDLTASFFGAYLCATSDVSHGKRWRRSRALSLPPPEGRALKSTHCTLARDVIAGPAGSVATGIARFRAMPIVPTVPTMPTELPVHSHAMGQSAASTDPIPILALFAIWRDSTVLTPHWRTC